MKKFLSVILALTMLLALAACGSKPTEEEKEPEAPVEEPVDLTAFYETYMADLSEKVGEDNTPAMMPMDEETLNNFYPGLSDIATKQLVANGAMIGAVAFELVMVEVENAEDVEKVQTIFETRKQAQADGGAWYPATCEAWENGAVVTNGNYVALLVTGEEQTNTVDAFNALFA